MVDLGIAFSVLECFECAISEPHEYCLAPDDEAVTDNDCCTPDVRSLSSTFVEELGLVIHTYSITISIIRFLIILITVKVS